MLEQAIKKLKDEIEKNKDNQAIKAVGEFLVGHVGSNPTDAEKILADKKTISSAMDFMKEKARKKQKSGYAVIAPDEGFKIVTEYFGISSVIKTAESVSRESKSAFKQPDFVTQSDLDINLDDLL